MWLEFFMWPQCVKLVYQIALNNRPPVRKNENPSALQCQFVEALINTSLTDGPLHFATSILAHLGIFQYIGSLFTLDYYLTLDKLSHWHLPIMCRLCSIHTLPENASSRRFVCGRKEWII
jgi:hypothetical protein